MLVIALAVIGFFTFQWYMGFLKSPVDPKGKVQIFIIDSGQSTKEIAESLKNEGLIRSPWIFLQELKTHDDSKIQAGDFKLSPSMNVTEIIENLEKGSVDARMTLLEGWRVEQMADKLEKDLGIESQEFLKLAKEGYMFPDTYFFNPEATADTVVRTLRSTFDSRFDDEIQSKMKANGLTPEEGVIMASLVEREARSDKVRTEVAGIILKRFKMGMKLDIDATVRYAKDTAEYQNKGTVEKYWQAITVADYSNIKSDYNTYLIPGLPPGPICNPSLSSLKAVANADANTPYLFYFHDLEGNTYYAKTLEEHNENVANNR